MTNEERYLRLCGRRQTFIVTSIDYSNGTMVIHGDGCMNDTLAIQTLVTSYYGLRVNPGDTITFTTTFTS